MLRKHRDVLAALAKRRQLDGEDVEPVEQIFAEPLFRRHGEQIPMGGCHQARIRPDRLVAAEPLELALLDQAEDLRLDLERQLPNLVEEDGAVLGGLEAPNPPARRTRERALLVAHQLALEEVRRDGSAVRLHERAPALAPEVDGAGDKLLAGPSLSDDEDRRVGARDDLDLLQNPSQAGATTDDAEVRAVLARTADRPQRASVDGSFDHVQEGLWVEWLREILHRARLDGADGDSMGLAGHDESRASRRDNAFLSLASVHLAGGSDAGMTMRTGCSELAAAAQHRTSVPSLPSSSVQCVDRSITRAPVAG
jgi:hypothetical protein